MNAPGYRTLSRLLGDPATDGAELFAAAGVVDAWLELGRLRAHGAAPWAPHPRRDVPAAVEAYRAADRAGSRAGALGWTRVAYFARSAEHATDAARRVDELLTADPDDPEVLCLAGYLAQRGFGRAPDLGAAMRFHRAAADRGSAESAFELSVLHATGVGVPADQDEATRWTFRAAELGSARAMANVAGMYATGRGVEHDPRAALAWYGRAADAGHAEAACTAGVMCLIGDGGLPVDSAAADRFLTLADELGFDVDRALGSMDLTRPDPTG
ncbi:tetratricopeptide repeat protein [Actinosynnema sp. NPDC023587]|uniref:tetratricopeptide repeat protein n=1 Tax=Actinosynnema sp. NPDC023587 TaxID=3154695 RepID=UPI0033C517B6